MNQSPTPTKKAIEVAALFLKLGLTAFGGPAAHIAMYHDEVVTRRRWLTEGQFLDLLGATNLIPGPNSTEMAIHIGLLRAGYTGLLLAGVCFILPAMLLVGIFAWVYARYGSTPQAGWLLAGIQPVVIAIILQALLSLGRKAIKGWPTLLATLIVLVLYFLGLNPLLVLLAGGGLVFLWENRKKIRLTFPPAMFALTTLGLPVSLSGATTLSVLFFTFLKIGAVLYGSGYVLLAFLHADFVDNLGWLTDQQLLDAVAVGQVTPGPVFTSATFIGYILAGVPGALLSTLGIFLPSFFFVILLHRYLPRLRSYEGASSLLDGVNAASLALMAAVTWQLASAYLLNPLAILIFLASLLALFRYKINTTWLILAGAILGALSQFLK